MPHLTLLLYRFRWLNAPLGVLLLLLQRTPVLRLATGGTLHFSLVAGDILKSAFTLTALGAYNSVTGATSFNAFPTAPTTVSPANTAAFGSMTVNGTPNTALGVLSFTVTGSPSTSKSWRVTGTLPSGLSVTGGTNVGGSVLVATVNPMRISGTPTSAGSQTVTINAYDTNNGTGSNTAPFFVTFNIAAPSSPPGFTGQPQSQTVVAGNSVTFTTSATGTPAPTFQWYFGSTANPLGGQTGSTLTLNNVQPSNAGTYFCRAFNSAAPGGVDSAAATLTVNVTPSFTAQPQSQTVVAGNSVTFTASATGTPAPSLQWYRDSTANPLGGQTGPTLTINNVQPGDAGTYFCRATNSAAPGGVDSSGANLNVTVLIPPSFSTQPQSQTVVAGNSVTYTASATGTPTPSLQWYRDSSANPLNGQTGTSLTLNNVQPSDAANYFCRAFNSAAPGGVDSAAATLTVNVTPSFTIQPQSQTVVAGNSVTFTASATGTPTPSLQWYRGSTANPLNGQTNSTLTLPNVQPSDAATYFCRATNSASPGGVDSTSVTLTVQSRLEAWRQLWFQSPANAGPGADTLDQDGDGLPNLIEYALGGIPTDVTSRPAPTITTITVSNALYATFTFTPLQTEMAYSVETASSPNGPWTSNSINNLNSGQSFTYTDSIATSANQPRYLRLRVTGN